MNGVLQIFITYACMLSESILSIGFFLSEEYESSGFTNKEKKFFHAKGPWGGHYITITCVLRLLIVNVNKVTCSYQHYNSSVNCR